MHRAADAVSDEIQFEDSDHGDGNEARTKRRVKWCRKVIEEWEERKKVVPQAEATDIESQCWMDAEQAQAQSEDTVNL
jgi:hypothetical protein